PKKEDLREGVQKKKDFSSNSPQKTKGVKKEFKKEGLKV
ncbi:hypothetical protein HPHPH41_1709, partial [Helicobacter pylori Hp H-41]